MNTTSDANTELPWISTMTFLGNKGIVARFVGDLLLRLKPDSRLITITTRGTSEDCSVRIVIAMSSEDIVERMAQNYSGQLTLTSQVNTQDGSSLPK